MGELLAQLLPVAIVGALAPLPIMVIVTLLMSETRGLLKASCFAGALLAVDSVIGIITLTSSGSGGAASTKNTAVTGTITAVLGALFVLMAIKQMLNAPDPDAPPPKFMSALDTMSAGRAALFGGIIGLINIKQLGIYVGGVAQIVHADITSAEQWVALVIFLVVLQMDVIVPTVVYAVARGWATRQLLKVRGWLVGHSRIIGIVLGLVIGTAFTFKGLGQIA